MNKPNMYGFYSEKGSRYGTCFWSTPDGGEVEITAAYETRDPDYRFDDKRFVGEVVQWVRQGRRGVLDRFGGMIRP